MERSGKPNFLTQAIVQTTGLHRRCLTAMLNLNRAALTQLKTSAAFNNNPPAAGTYGVIRNFTPGAPGASETLRNATITMSGVRQVSELQGKRLIRFNV